MKLIKVTLFTLLLLFGCKSIIEDNHEGNKVLNENVGLIIIDAQKWYIPGHPESMYTLWNIGGHDRESEELIRAMDSVLSWANKEKLKVFVTYEANDTGRYDLPDELKKNLDSSRTEHFVKLFYAAPKHEEFDKKLKDSKIHNWIVIGAETDVCIYQTAKYLLEKGDNVTLVSEAIYSGRNNTEVSKDNFVSFGANIINIKDLYNTKNLFEKTAKQKEVSIQYNDIMLTVFPFDNITDSLKNTASYIRLLYLINYANIIGIPVESANLDSISTKGKLRLVAGNLTADKYAELDDKVEDTLLIISDCLPFLSYHNQAIEWNKQTLKMLFYELMGSVEFYFKPIEEFDDWQKHLKKAMLEGKLDYVESNQNL